MKNWIGPFIIFIGVLHITVGFIFLGEIGLELLGEGLFNTVNGQPKREAFFWFTFSGVMIIFIGQWIHWNQRKQVRIPRFLGWNLLVLGIVAVFIMPISGAWLLFIPTIALLLNQRKTTDALN